MARDRLFIALLLLSLPVIVGGCSGTQRGGATNSAARNIEAVGVVQMFWESCLAHDTEAVADIMIEDSRWTAQQAIRFFYPIDNSQAIGHHGRPLFVVKRVETGAADRAVVIGDFVFREPTTAHTIWDVLDKDFRFDLVKTDGNWRIDLSRYTPR